MATTKKKIIPIEVRDEYILGSGVSIGAVGSFDSMVLRVKFDDSWIGLNKYATWTDAQGNSGQQTQISPFELVDGEAHTYDVPVPQLPLTYAGPVRLSFTGYAMTADGASIDRIMNTATGTFIVLESNAMRLGDGTVTPTLADQLTATVNECTKRVAAAEGKIDEFEEAETERANAEMTRGANEETRIEYENERVTAEEQRQIAELGALGNYYEEEANAVHNSLGEVVPNEQGGRVGAEIQRRHDEAERISNEIDRKQKETERKDNESERVSNENRRIEKDGYREAQVEYIVNLVGDTDAALDAILAIQNGLIGGAR
jgi:hypothetical protein